MRIASSLENKEPGGFPQVMPGLFGGTGRVHSAYDLAVRDAQREQLRRATPLHDQGRLGRAPPALDEDREEVLALTASG
eukprot:8039538-Alexandrium_andersonii.AAC.1